tara:strand:- start:408 stop:950 length:543 start_codon:yes stop_codon:yes gene_type:complete
MQLVPILPFLCLSHIIITLYLMYAFYSTGESSIRSVRVLFSVCARATVHASLRACVHVQVLAINPGDVKSLYRRALASWQLGEVEQACESLEQILRKKVAEYSEVAESTHCKKLARSMIRQIETSEKRAELIEKRMARALAVSTPQTGAVPGGGPVPKAEEQPNVFADGSLLGTSTDLRL